MNRRWIVTPLACFTSLALTAAGCATSQYAPQVVARGELTVRYDGGFELSAGGQRVAHGLTYGGLETYVRCVPQAQEHARLAAQSGRIGIAFSVLGGTLGAAGLVGLGAVADTDHLVPWALAGIGLATAGLTFAILSRRYKNHANGHALDAMNFYNDSVGSLGATCDDLQYPPPAGPASPEPPTVPMAPAAPEPIAPDSLPPPPTR